MLESYDNLERQVRAKLKRETCALQNVERLDGARYQVLRQLQVGGQTYPQLHNALTLSASSTHKAVEGLLKLAHIRHEGNLKSRKHRAIFYLTETGLQLLEQTKNFVHSSQVN